MAEDYCELCDLPLSQCVHGRPPPPEPPARPRTSTPKATAPRVTRSTTAARAASSSGGAASKPPPPRRRTPAEDFRGPILRMLQDAGGQLPADGVFETLEEQLGERLRSGDRESMPSGELRWQYAARSARRQLMQEGLVASGEPGVWRLTDEGRTATD